MEYTYERVEYHNGVVEYEILSPNNTVVHWVSTLAAAVAYVAWYNKQLNIRATAH